MAVALSHLEAQRQLLGRHRKQKVQLQKFFGKCEMPDGSIKFLVAKATDAVDASKKLHKGYRIACVVDILTEVDMEKQWNKLKPSYIQRSQLR